MASVMRVEDYTDYVLDLLSEAADRLSQTHRQAQEALDSSSLSQSS
jgi:hypothetical protein